jgi:hypothetical protein
MINPTTKMNTVISLNEEELVCYYAVKHVLLTHIDELTNDDINFANNYICSFYDHSCQINKCFTYDNLVQFLVYANRATICKFA